MGSVIKCRLCEKSVARRSQSFEKRMSLLREHYKQKHTSAFKKSIKKGVEARKAKTVNKRK